jgi:tetratricopeptide (TPR) repeat protein
MEVKVLLTDQRIEKSEEVEINGAYYLADHYSDKILYYDQNGTLAAWKVKEVPMDKTNLELLSGVYSSLEKTLELDDRGRSDKDVADQLQALRTRYYNEAMSNYALGNFEKSSVFFEKASEIGAHNLIGQDTVFIYYAGITAFMNNDADRAIQFLNKAVEYDYDADGDAYSYIAEAYKAQGDIEKAKEILNKGFTKYPSAQSILVSLINAYLESDDDPEKILDLIRHAQKNEPNNASLYYAEGNVWKNLGELEKAIESYKKSVEIDDTYYFGYFAIGAAYYDTAVELQAKAAEEMDDEKYQKMVEELENLLLSALEPFEKAFNGTEDAEIKGVVAEYLKNIYFRFREKGDEYMEGFEKYDAYTKNPQ